MKYYIWNVPRRRLLNIKEQYLYRKKHWYSPKEVWLSDFNMWCSTWNKISPSLKEMTQISEEGAFLLLL